MKYSLGRGLKRLLVFQTFPETTDMNLVHKMMSENIKLLFCPYLGYAPHCQPSLKGNKKASKRGISVT